MAADEPEVLNGIAPKPEPEAEERAQEVFDDEQAPKKEQADEASPESNDADAKIA